MIHDFKHDTLSYSSWFDTSNVVGDQSAVVVADPYARNATVTIKYGSLGDEESEMETIDNGGSVNLSIPTPVVLETLEDVSGIFHTSGTYNGRFILDQEVPALSKVVAKVVDHDGVMKTTGTDAGYVMYYRESGSESFTKVGDSGAASAYPPSNLNQKATGVDYVFTVPVNVDAFAIYAPSARFNEAGDITISFTVADEKVINVKSEAFSDTKTYTVEIACAPADVRLAPDPPTT